MSSEKNIHIPLGYKSSPLGPIPSDWEVKNLGDIGKISAGVGFPEEFQGTINGDYPFFKVSDTNILGNEKFLITANNYVSKDLVKNLNLKTYKKGTLIFPKVGAVLYSNKRRVLSQESIVDNNLGTFQMEKGDQEFIYQIFLNIDFGKFSNGGALPSINGNTVGNIQIPFPTLPEQTAIANLLSTWDEAISKVSKLIEQHENKKIWLIQKLFNSQKSRISAGGIFKSISIKGTSNEVLLSATQDRGIIPRDMLEGRVTMPNNGETEGYKLVESGDFVISLRSFQGGLEYSEYRGVVSPAYTVLKPRKRISNSYYRYYFKSYDFIGHLSIAVVGIRDGKQISYDDFCTVKIPNPSYDNQLFAATILEKSDQEIQLLKSKLEKFKEQKKGLMQQLLTGKKRLKF